MVMLNLGQLTCRFVTETNCSQLAVWISQSQKVHESYGAVQKSYYCTWCLCTGVEQVQLAVYFSVFFCGLITQLLLWKPRSAHILTLSAHSCFLSTDRYSILRQRKVPFLQRIFHSTLAESIIFRQRKYHSTSGVKNQSLSEIVIKW